jgi:tetratricopeptide (TPR) repeat protein
VSAAVRHATVAGVLAELPEEPLREVQAWTLAAEAAAAAGGAEEAEALFRAALASAAVDLSAGTGAAGGGHLAEGTGVGVGGEGAVRGSARGGEGHLAEGAGSSGEGAGGWLGAPEDDVASAAIGAAAGGLGRVLLGLGRGEEATRALAFAAGRRGLADAAAIECALLAAGAAISGGRVAEAEAVLVALRRARAVDERVLLELARAYALQGRVDAADAALGELLARASTPALRAEALLRRAKLRDFMADPRGGVGARRWAVAGGVRGGSAARRGA